jgi:hypothetical protein
MNIGRKSARRAFYSLFLASAQLTRNFARQIKTKKPPLEIEKLAINERAAIYKSDIDSDRDFFYQEMIDIEDDDQMMQFYTSRKDEIDGFGVKLLIEKLVKNRRNGKIGKRKIFRNMVDGREKEKYAIIERLLDDRVVGGIDKLSISELVELIEIASKCQLNSYEFTLLVIKRFLIENKLQPTQWIYELLLRCVRQDSDTYPVILKMLEIDLGLKRIQPDDDTVVLSLLERTLSYGGDNLILTKQLEFYLEQFAAIKLSTKQATFILNSYSENNYRTPNLNILDYVTLALLPSISKMNLEQLRDLLAKAVTIGFEHFSLTAAVSRRLFDILSEKAIMASITAPGYSDDIDYSQDDVDEEADVEDEETLEAITAKLFGNRSTLIPSKDDVEAGDEAKEPQELLLGERISFLPEILYHFVKLNVLCR